MAFQTLGEALNHAKEPVDLNKEQPNGMAVETIRLELWGCAVQNGIRGLELNPKVTQKTLLEKLNTACARERKAPIEESDLAKAAVKAFIQSLRGRLGSADVIGSLLKLPAE